MSGWQVLRGLHVSDADPTPHILIRVQGDRYHLRLEASHCNFDITRHADGAAQRPSGIAPWAGPGG